MRIEIDPRLGEVEVKAELTADQLHINLVWGERYRYYVDGCVTSHPEEMLSLTITESDKEDGPFYKIEFIPETTGEQESLGRPGLMLQGRDKETEVVVFLREWWIDKEWASVATASNKTAVARDGPG